jgi:hypothetical protein
MVSNSGSDKRQETDYKYNNLYEVTKTVRFELKPSKETLEKINKEKLFKKPENTRIIKNDTQINWEELNSFIKKTKEFYGTYSNITDFLNNENCNFDNIHIYSELIRLCGGEARDLYQKNFARKGNWKKIITLENEKEADVSYKVNESSSIGTFNAKFDKNISNYGKGIVGELIVDKLEEYKNVLNVKIIKLEAEVTQQEKAKSFTNEYLFGKIKTLCITLEKVCNLFLQFNLNQTEINEKDLEDKFSEKCKLLNFEEVKKLVVEILEEIELYNNKNAKRKYTLNLRGICPRVLDSSKETIKDYTKTEKEILEEIDELEAELQNLKDTKKELKTKRSHIKNEIAIKITDITNKENIKLDKNKLKDWDSKKIIKIDLQKNFKLNEKSNLDQVKKFTKEIIEKHVSSNAKVNISNNCQEIYNLIFQPYVFEKETKQKTFLKIHKECEEKNKKFQEKSSTLNQLQKDLENIRISHFAKIISFNGKYFLALEKVIDENNKKKQLSGFALNNLQSSQNSNYKILNYKSLTFKALKKLCLERDGTIFAGFLRDEQGNWIYEKDKNGKIKKDKRGYPKKQKDEEIKKLWGKYLSESKGFTNNDFRTFKIKLKGILLNPRNDFDFIFDREFVNSVFYTSQNMEDLIRNIEESFYNLSWQNCDWKNLKQFEKDKKIELYQIYNKDFALDEYFARDTESDKNKLEKQKESVKNEKYKPNLFTIYWNNFFSQISNLTCKCDKQRLIPEGKFYVKLASETEKYKVIGDKKIENRKSQNKIYGDFYFIFNPVAELNNKKKLEIRASAQEKQPKNRIKSFNKYLQEKVEGKNELYFIGLDRGENSLVSYGLFKFKKKKIESDDVLVRFDSKVGEENWVLDEILELQDLSAVKVFNQKGNWQKSIFVEQKEDEYFYNKKEDGDYDEILNFKNGGKRKTELEKENSEAVFCLLPIRNKQREKTGAYSLKCLSWKEDNGVVYNYRVAQEKLREERLEQLKLQENFKDLSEDEKERILEQREIDLQETEEFKNGFVSNLVGFLAEKVEKYEALISLENLNNSGGKEGNLNKTFGATVYQIIENRLMSKFSYLVIKLNKQNHSQIVPKIRKIEELKIDQITKNEKLKDYNLGEVLITDEINTSKICPNCGYSKIVLMIKKLK